MVGVLPLPVWDEGAAQAPSALVEFFSAYPEKIEVFGEGVITQGEIAVFSFAQVGWAVAQKSRTA